MPPKKAATPAAPAPAAQPPKSEPKPPAAEKPQQQQGPPKKAAAVAPAASVLAPAPPAHAAQGQQGGRGGRGGPRDQAGGSNQRGPQRQQQQDQAAAPVEGGEVEKKEKRLPRLTGDPEEDAVVQAILDFNAKQEANNAAIRGIQETMSGKMTPAGQQKDLSTAIKAITAEIETLGKRREAIIAQLKDVRTSRSTRIDEIKKVRERLSIQIGRNDTVDVVLAKVDKEIKELEARQSSTAMALSEEKMVVKKLGSLNVDKRLVVSYFSLNQSLDEDKPKMEALDKEFDDIKTRIDNLVKQRDAKKRERDAIKQLADEQFAQRNDLNEQRRLLIEENKKIRTDETAKWTELREIGKRKFNQRKVDRQAEWERQNAERAKQRAERDQKRLEKELVSVPYEWEIEEVTRLIKYLEDITLKPQKEAAEKAAAAAAAAASLPEGVTILRRDDDNDERKGGQQKGKGRKQTTQKVQSEDAAITHNIQTLMAFEKHSLAPPVRIADAPATVVQLKAKLDEYAHLQKVAEQERQAKLNALKSSNSASEGEASAGAAAGNGAAVPAAAAASPAAVVKSEEEPADLD